MDKEMKIAFEYDIISTCNLNCEGCTHYAPIGDNEDVLSIEKADIELKLLSNIISDHCNTINIMGGEPLLNPNIIEILSLTRKYFPKTEIQIVTNGILLADMEPDFWQACNELSVGIALTVYPIKIRLDKITSCANEYKVPYSLYRNGKYFYHFLLDEFGKQDINDSYIKCNLKNFPLYHDGKLYPCTIAGCVYKLNNYYNVNFEVSENDCLCIDAETTLEDVYEFLGKPVSFCKYCMVSQWYDDNNRFKWTESKKDKHEWINCI